MTRPPEPVLNEVISFMSTHLESAPGLTLHRGPLYGRYRAYGGSLTLDEFTSAAMFVLGEGVGEGHHHHWPSIRLKGGPRPTAEESRAVSEFVRAVTEYVPGAVLSKYVLWTHYVESGGQIPRGTFMTCAYSVLGNSRRNDDGYGWPNRRLRGGDDDA